MTITKKSLIIHSIDLILIVSACFLYYFSIDYIGSKLTLSFFRGDASYYYVKITEGEWGEIYPLEPLLNVLCLPYKNLDFTKYLIVSNLPSFALSIISAKILGVSGIRLLSVMVLLSFSYFGLHFLFNFQRQFISLSLLLLGMTTMGKIRILPLLMAPMGHIWATLPALMIFSAPYLHKKIVRYLAAILFPLVLIMLFIVGGSAFSEKVASYSAYGDENPFRLIIRSVIQLGFISGMVFILGGFKKLEDGLRKKVVLYSIAMLISALIPTASALFVRFDYYFYPIIIILLFVDMGKPEVSTIRVVLASALVLAYSIASGIQWVNSISPWIFYGIM